MNIHLLFIPQDGPLGYVYK